MNSHVTATNPPAKCPSCQGLMTVREVECEKCDLQIRGHFGSVARFEALTDDQMRFLETFLACRGVIRDIEAALSISYPTVKSRLDTLLRQLGLSEGRAPVQSQEDIASAKRAQVLAELEAGRIDPASAIERLNELKA